MISMIRSPCVVSLPSQGAMLFVFLILTFECYQLAYIPRFAVAVELYKFPLAFPKNLIFRILSIDVHLFSRRPVPPWLFPWETKITRMKS